ncbi:MAG: ATP-dependent DNA helicase [Actinomycetota bacterium]|nr:ATP-dependent DNA helicase [Actinomycetota bacterium]
MRQSRSRSWVLDTTQPAPIAPAILDPEQQQVVDHRAGPLLVLAGPGTGKTTTIVEAITARITDPSDPLEPGAVLALTFGRRAAGELRDKVVQRLGGGVSPLVATFHSFAYGLMQQTATVGELRDPPRLLSGAEEDVRIRDLLVGALQDGTINWPEELAGAVTTLGLANEIRSVLARARELGLDPGQLERIGARSGRPAWAALGALAEQESAVMVLENVCDYTELLHRAVIAARAPDVAAQMHRTYRAIYVDEYQDTDQLQVELLKALVGPRTSLVVVGDPDQAIYGFRGADIHGILNFPEQFRTSTGEPAPTVILQRTRRFGPNIRKAATAILGARPIGSFTKEQVHAHRNPSCLGGSPVAGQTATDTVEVQLFDSESSRAAHIAEQIRRAHLDDGLPWADLAVLVRSARQIPLVQRALMQAGVPTTIAADEIPLRAEPAVAVLLQVAEMAIDPSRITAEQAVDLLTGPLGGLDAAELRRFGRALRAAARLADPLTPPGFSDQLIRDTLRGDLEIPATLPATDPARLAVERSTALLRAAHQLIRSGAAPEAVLWTIWSGRVAREQLAGGRSHGWPERLQNAALAGSRAAHHDLDAVIALFETAERTQSRYKGFAGLRNFLILLSNQQLPAESVADRSLSSDAVRILTAHRAKGLEWEAVWVVGTEEGQWPDLRTRGSILEPDRLTRAGVGDGVRPADLLAEERRLFYVACTRARQRVVVTAIASGTDTGPQPSRFIGALGVVAETKSGRPRFTAALDGLVARLRQTCMDEESSPALREAAVARLASLAGAEDESGEPLVPVANPDSWWAIGAVTEGAHPVRSADVPITLSGSGLESINSCALRWYFEHEARAETLRPAATKFGSVVHAVADYVAKDEVSADIDSMDALVDRVWPDLRFESAWQSAAERAQAREALTRFLVYHLRADRRLVASEESEEAFVEVPTPAGGLERVHLRGFLDRIEIDSQGRSVAIDLKNMKTPPADSKVPEHAQLGVYQSLLRAGGHEVGGAALVQLRVNASKGALEPKVQFQEPLEQVSPTWVDLELGAAAQTLRTEEFTAVTGSHCMFCAHKRNCPAQPEGAQVVL